MRHLIAAALVSMTVTPTLVHAAEWQIDPEASKLTFEATQGGSTFTGEFPEFSGEIVFDPNDLAAGKLAITIPIAGVTTYSAERDGQILGTTWFAASQFPEATYTADGFTAAESGGYIAEGRLALKGIEQPLPLTFTLDIENGRAVADGVATIVRTDHEIGTGQFVDGNTIGLDVKVIVHIEADRVEELGPAG